MLSRYLMFSILPQISENQIQVFESVSFSSINPTLLCFLLAIMHSSILPLILALSAQITTTLAQTTTSTSSVTPPVPTATGAFNAWVLEGFGSSSGNIQHKFIDASNRHFFIGNSSATYCPLPATECPTLPATGCEITCYDPYCFLNVEVPGGQQMYVEETGALGFTQAHSAAIPEGAVLGGFTTRGYFGFTGLETVPNSNTAGSTLLACPVVANGTGPGLVYQVFANISGLSDADVPDGNVADCQGFVADILSTEQTPGAWEYV